MKKQIKKSSQKVTHKKIRPFPFDQKQRKKSKKLKFPFLSNLKKRIPIVSLKKIKQENLKRFFQGNIVEIILLIIGFLFIIHPTILNLKISFTLLVIGSFLILLLYKEPGKSEQSIYPAFKIASFNHNNPKMIYYFKEKTKIALRKRIIQKLEDMKNQNINLKNIQFTVSDKITFVLIIWTIILFMITQSIPLEIYFILIFISLLSIKELTNTFTTNLLKKRINVFIFVFLMAYSYIITQKIIVIIT